MPKAKPCTTPKLVWKWRPDDVWGEVLVLYLGRRALLAIWWVPVENAPALDPWHGWRAAFEACPWDGDLHRWLGTRLTLEEAQAEAIRLFWYLCQEMRTNCELAQRAVEPLMPRKGGRP